MIRFRFGIGVLAVILAAGIAATMFMVHVHRDICHDLEKASGFAAASQLDEADSHIRTAKENWENHRHLVASLAEHTDMDEIDSLFRQLAAYQKIRDADACAAVCAELAYRVESLGESHDLSWWNLL